MSQTITSTRMSDGLNQARAMRVTEIITDFRNIQNYIASIRLRPSAEEYNEEGYVLLRRCVTEAQALLAQPFHQSGGNGNGRSNEKEEEERRRAELRRIIVDAAVRRFKAQKIYLRAVAALRWVNARYGVLAGQRAHAGHAAALGQVSNQLRAELAGITDSRVESTLRQPDETAGKWLDEDPGLALIQRFVGNGNGGGR